MGCGCKCRESVEDFEKTIKETLDLMLSRLGATESEKILALNEIGVVLSAPEDVCVTKTIPYIIFKNIAPRKGEKGVEEDLMHFFEYNPESIQRGKKIYNSCLPNSSD